jgi:hypothetical protein
LPELSRDVLADQAAGDGEAGFLARVGRLAARDVIRGVVGFSGPVAGRVAANYHKRAPGRRDLAALRAAAEPEERNRQAAPEIPALGTRTPGGDQAATEATGFACAPLLRPAPRP